MHTLVGFKPRVPVYGTLNCLIKCINATAPSSPVLKSGSHWCTLHYFLAVWLFICFCLVGVFFFVRVLNKSKFYYTSSFATQILNTKKQQQQHVFTHVG